MRKLQLLLNILIPLLIVIIIIVNLMNLFPGIIPSFLTDSTSTTIRSETATATTAAIDDIAANADIYAATINAPSTSTVSATPTAAITGETVATSAAVNRDDDVTVTASAVSAIAPSVSTAATTPAASAPTASSTPPSTVATLVATATPTASTTTAASASASAPTTAAATTDSAASDSAAATTAATTSAASASATATATATTSEMSAPVASTPVATDTTAASAAATNPAASAPTTAAATTAPTTSAPSANSDEGKLKGKTICIDPGHQKKGNSALEPVTPGGSSKKAKVSSGTAGLDTKTPEYELTLAVGLKLKALLEKEGAKVVMTRQSHDVDVSNVERAKIGNDANADISVRIHADGNNNRSVKGISMLVPAGSTDYLSSSAVEKSQSAGKTVLDAVIKKTGANSRGISKRSDMTGFNWSKVPVILIEMGFMTNAEEDRLLDTDAYRDKLASGLCQGLINYFNS